MDYGEIDFSLSSPRRKQLLNKIGLNFTVEPSYIDEKPNYDMDFGPLVADMAFQKAMSVAKKHNQGLVLGADTIVVLEQDILGKPATMEEAKEMLSRLSGQWHSVFTAYL